MPLDLRRSSSCSGLRFGRQRVDEAQNEDRSARHSRGSSSGFLPARPGVSANTPEHTLDPNAGYSLMTLVFRVDTAERPPMLSCDGSSSLMRVPIYVCVYSIVLCPCRRIGKQCGAGRAAGCNPEVCGAAGREQTIVLPEGACSCNGLDPERPPIILRGPQGGLCSPGYLSRRKPCHAPDYRTCSRVWGRSAPAPWRRRAPAAASATSREELQAGRI